MNSHVFAPAVKRIFLVLAFGLGAVWAPAQGVLNFATAAGGPGGTVNAPGTNVHAIPPFNRASGADFLAQLYIGPAGITDPTLLTTNGVSGASAIFRTGAEAGYIIGGTRVIEGYAAGTTITVQLRAWNTSAGASWEESSVLFRTGTGGPDVPALIQVTLGDGVGTTPNLVGMQGYYIGAIPEPGTWALLTLGGAVFAFRLRRRRRR